MSEAQGKEDLNVELDDVRSDCIILVVTLTGRQFKKLDRIFATIEDKEFGKVAGTWKLLKKDCDEKVQHVKFDGLQGSTFYVIKVEASLANDERCTKRKLGFTLKEDSLLPPAQISKKENQKFHNFLKAKSGSGATGGTQSLPKSNHFLLSKAEGTFVSHRKNFDSQENGVSYSEKEFIKSITTDSDPFIVGMMGGKKTIERNIMNGRQSKGIKEFINGGLKFARPKSRQRERMQRTMLYNSGLSYLSKARIDNDKLPNGFKMFENSWGLGPFYSYNRNFEDLKTVYDDNKAGKFAEPWIDPIKDQDKLKGDPVAHGVSQINMSALDLVTPYGDFGMQFVRGLAEKSGLGKVGE